MDPSIHGQLDGARSEKLPVEARHRCSISAIGQGLIYDAAEVFVTEVLRGDWVKGRNPFELMSMPTHMIPAVGTQSWTQSRHRRRRCRRTFSLDSPPQL
jgi:hypothetical protein